MILRLISIYKVIDRDRGVVGVVEIEEIEQEIIVLDQYQYFQKDEKKKSKTDKYWLKNL